MLCSILFHMNFVKSINSWYLIVVIMHSVGTNKFIRCLLFSRIPSIIVATPFQGSGSLFWGRPSPQTPSNASFLAIFMTKFLNLYGFPFSYNAFWPSEGTLSNFDTSPFVTAILTWFPKVFPSLYPFTNYSTNSRSKCPKFEQIYPNPTSSKISSTSSSLLNIDITVIYFSFLTFTSRWLNVTSSNISFLWCKVFSLFLILHFFSPFSTIAIFSVSVVTIFSISFNLEDLPEVEILLWLNLFNHLRDYLPPLAWILRSVKI